MYYSSLRYEELLTNLQVKCEQYWPQSFTAESRYDDITVCCVPYEEWADCVVRVLEVTKVDCNSLFLF